MNKKIIALVIGILAIMPAVALAAPKPVSDYSNPKGKVNGPAGKSHIAHLYLVEKIPEGDWPIVADGAWGKMRFGTKKNNFVFNGHELDAETDYTLLRYEGTTWPDVECLASGTTDVDGNIHLSGDVGSYGDKVWLVLSGDVDCENAVMTGWQPTEYLFEYALI